MEPPFSSIIGSICLSCNWAIAVAVFVCFLLMKVSMLVALFCFTCYCGCDGNICIRVDSVSLPSQEHMFLEWVIADMLVGIYFIRGECLSTCCTDDFDGFCSLTKNHNTIKNSHDTDVFDFICLPSGQKCGLQILDWA